MRHLMIGALCATLLFATACASESPTEEPRAVTTQAREGAKSSGEKGTEATGTGRRSKEADDGKQGDESEDSGDDGGTSSGSGSDFTEGAEENDGSTPIAPAAGTYSFAQSGYEEFCSTDCERYDLPRTSRTIVDVQRRGDGAVALTSELHTTDDRLVRSTFIYTSEQALITYVYARFVYESITITEEYEPKPAVAAFSFPLHAGDHWSGHWEAKVSGDYDVTVVGQEQVTVAGGVVDAFKVVTETTFRGRYEGTADVTAWFDPATRSVVATKGDVDLRSSFGRYHTRFRTSLRAGPEYR